jgi:hypothetical protein
VRADDDRHVSVTPQPDGMAQVRGSLAAPAAAAFDKRLSEMAKSVCAKDSRTVAQRRADALIALTEGRALACDCGQADCPTRVDDAEPVPGGVRAVINVIASEATVTGDSDQPGYLEGYGVIDAEQVRELSDTAALRLVECPTVTPEEALRYQPSAALERWIRCRDVTCRFPGCDRPAGICDIDHTIPFNHADPAAGGLTVPWNLACYCREHHLWKTFWGGTTNNSKTAPSFVWDTSFGGWPELRWDSSENELLTTKPRETARLRPSAARALTRDHRFFPEPPA